MNPNLSFKLGLLIGFLDELVRQIETEGEAMLLEADGHRLRGLSHDVKKLLYEPEIRPVVAAK